MRPFKEGTGYYNVWEAFPDEGWYTVHDLVDDVDNPLYKDKQILQSFLVDLVDRDALEQRKEPGHLTEYRKCKRQ